MPTLFYSKIACLENTNGEPCQAHPSAAIEYHTGEFVLATPEGGSESYIVGIPQASLWSWLYTERPQLWEIIANEDVKESAPILAICFLFIGIMGGIFVWLGFPADVTQAISPSSTVASDRNAALFRSVVIASLTLLVFVIIMQFRKGSLTEAAAFSSVTLAATALSLSPWARLQVARACLAATGRVPWRLVRFLEEAHSRGVLRQAGAVYQFRHATLQERLISRSRSTAPRPSPAPPRHHARHRS